jgi:hypothetical protein|tara:strand:- start:24806 stop:24985 length:180 start_codon:yes stop_codon:yes gene_type:complete
MVSLNASKRVRVPVEAVEAVEEGEEGEVVEAAAHQVSIWIERMRKDVPVVVAEAAVHIL